jgi:ApbE superfamily uncharacterized protein (UPF0280 family)
MDDNGGDIAIHVMGNKVNGRIYVEHNVKDNDVGIIEPRRFELKQCNKDEEESMDLMMILRCEVL